MNSFDDYSRAGKIASVVRDHAKTMDHTGKSLEQICDLLENEINTHGGRPAFPVNVSLNEIAAHYTAEPNDSTIVSNSDILKIDIGVHINGFIADTAVSVSHDPKNQLIISAAEIALQEAIRMAKANAKTSEIGRVIENTINRHGFKPIQNLSGHSLDQFTIHAGKSIPNIWTPGSFSLSPNQTYAIEPFVTTKDGQGVVYEGKTRNIFAIVSRKPTKDKSSNEFLQSLWNKFKTLPFAMRWILAEHDESEARKLLKILLDRKNVYSYPILVEGMGKLVSQAEHTIIPSENNTIIITK